MTREEIMNMPAGKEMDTLIAEKVLGLNSKIEECPYCYSAMWIGKERSWCGQCHEWRYSLYKNYSDDIAAAWAVVEKLSISVVPIEDPDGWVCGCDQRFNLDYQWYERNLSDWAHAGTAPLAICRAALLAIIDNL